MLRRKFFLLPVLCEQQASLSSGYRSTITKFYTSSITSELGFWVCVLGHTKWPQNYQFPTQKHAVPPGKFIRDLVSRFVLGAGHKAMLCLACTKIPDSQKASSCSASIMLLGHTVQAQCTLLTKADRSGMLKVPPCKEVFPNIAVSGCFLNSFLHSHTFLNLLVSLNKMFLRSNKKKKKTTQNKPKNPPHNLLSPSLRGSGVWEQLTWFSPKGLTGCNRGVSQSCSLWGPFQSPWSAWKNPGPHNCITEVSSSLRPPPHPCHMALSTGNPIAAAWFCKGRGRVITQKRPRFFSQGSHLILPDKLHTDCIKIADLRP